MAPPRCVVHIRSATNNNERGATGKGVVGNSLVAFAKFSARRGHAVPAPFFNRLLGIPFAGAILGPLGLETAWAGKQDLCSAFCKCRNAKQQNQCLDACKKCSGNTSRLGGSCGSYTCCSIASCKGVCSNLKSDPNGG